MNEQSNEQQLQSQLTSIKARLFDSQEAVQQLNEFIGKVAQKVSFRGQSLEELLERIKPIAQPQQAPEGE